MFEISIEKVVHVIFLARDRTSRDQAGAFIDGLNEDEQAHLTAIAWVGRGAFEPEDYNDAVANALNEKTVPTSDYLTGMPHLAENLESGLEALGVDVTDAEEGFL